MSTPQTRSSDFKIKCTFCSMEAPLRSSSKCHKCDGRLCETCSNRKIGKLCRSCSVNMLETFADKIRKKYPNDPEKMDQLKQVEESIDELRQK